MLFGWICRSVLFLAPLLPPKNWRASDEDWENYEVAKDNPRHVKDLVHCGNLHESENTKRRYAIIRTGQGASATKSQANHFLHCIDVYLR